MSRFARKLLFAVLVLTGATTAMAQRFRLPVLVLDSLDEHPVADVAIAVDGRVQYTTDAEGKAEIGWDRQESVPVRFTHTSYRPFEVRIAEDDVEEGVTWVVRLLPRDLQLGEVTVGRAMPETVFERSDLHAADLLINEEGLWVLAYEHPRMLREERAAGKEILRDVRLVLLDTAFHEMASCPVPEDVLGLRHDLRNDVVIEGAGHAFSVRRIGRELVLHPFGLDELWHAVLPWTDSIPGWVIGSNADPTYPELDHLAFDPRRDSTRRICSVVDTFMMDLFRSEYKNMKGPDKVAAMNLAAQLGVDKETVAGYMNGFSHNVWYRPLYAPLFVVGDTMLVFDHVRGRMRKFTRSFKAMGEVPLPYHAKTEGRYWSGRLVQDRETEQVYALFRKYGTTWLRAIDPVSGALGAPFRLANSYPDRVQVHAGKVYYIWRPYGSLQKRTIYRETLKR